VFLNVFLATPMMVAGTWAFFSTTSSPGPPEKARPEGCSARQQLVRSQAGVTIA
jgi:hypothetical protein